MSGGTLPSFNDHSFVNITVSAAFGGHSGANLIASDTTINGFSSFCVDTRQFTITLFYNVTNSYGYVSKSQDSNCPFTLQSVNDYLSFSKFCVSTSLLAGACTIDLFGYPEFGSGVKFTSLYFQFTKGELITGTPKPLQGVTDVSGGGGSGGGGSGGGGSVLVYSNIGVCKSGSIGYVPLQDGQVKIAGGGGSGGGGSGGGGSHHHHHH
nr:S1CD [synthetic construct]